MRRTLRALSSILAGLAAGALSYLASPPKGVSVHWDPSTDANNSWTAVPGIYAVVSAVLVVLGGWLIRWVTNSRRLLAGECAVGVGLIVFAGIQRIVGVSTLLAFGAALVVALASFAIATSSRSHS